jgi:hypothetical protein
LNREELVRSLIQYAAAGRLDAQPLQAVLQQLLGPQAPPLPAGELLEALDGLEGPAFLAVSKQLRESRRKDALAHHGFRVRGQAVPETLAASLRDLPLQMRSGWAVRDSAMSPIQTALKVLADRSFFTTHREKAPGFAVALEKQYQQALDAALGSAHAWESPSLVGMVSEVEKQAAAGRLDVSKILPSLKQSIDRNRQKAVEAVERAISRPEEPLPADLDAEIFFTTLGARLAAAQTREETRRLIDLAFQWPTDQGAAYLLQLPLDPWAQERAALLLTLRFGQPSGRPLGTWDACRTWLQLTVGGKGLAVEGSKIIVRKRPLAMLYLWYSRQNDADPAALAELEKMVFARLESVTLHDFIERWAATMPKDELRALSGAEPSAVQFLEEPKAVAPPEPVPVAPLAEPAAPPPPRKIVAPRPPPKPSVWDAHLKPFFLENWYMVAGVAMVLVGSSLLAYYTWDKGWLIRYTIMPSLLGAFTMALAWLGGWIERKDATLKGTGAILRGAAIGLLPINFMAVALLANDHDVGKYRSVAVPVMGALYLSLFGWGLRRWCAAVHPGLGLTLGGSVLFLNVLVMLAGAQGMVSRTPLLWVIGGGFYLGFFALMAAVIWFSRKILNGELAKERRVPWFFGAALAGTFLQVFAWVHGYLQHLPKVHTYAPMVILAGWLVLVVERRSLELRGEGEKHGAESFLGFAFILLGVLMGIGDHALRIVTFLLAGVVWIYQSLPRRQALHYWIGLTFVTLGGASVGLLTGFEAQWWPTLGIGLAVALGLFARLVRSNEELSRAAGGMQAAVLILTVLVTMLAHVPRFRAAGHLAVVAALFGVLAWRDGKIRWLQTGMVVLALALPYLAGMDLAARRLHSTTLVFGLAALSLVWIAATLIVRSPLLTGARSTVLWIYGAMAIACMAARATIDPDAIHDLPWLDIGGPLLMTVVLVWASYFSRSLVPAGMAMLIALVLTPELKERLQVAYPHLGWGSGLGSSIAAVGLMIGAMILRRMPSLQDLGDGDKYMGQVPYPLIRRNHTLFTLPMVASAFFLAVKVEFWNQFAGGNPLKTSIAVFLSGVVWTLIAVYQRGPKAVQAATYVGLFWMVVGVASAMQNIPGIAREETTILAVALFVQALYFGYRYALERKFPWAADLLTRPTLMTLRIGTVLIAAICILVLLTGSRLRTELILLTTVAALQLAWHGLATRRQFFGYVLFALDLATLTAANKKDGFVVAALGLVIAVQALQAGLEFRKPWYDYLKPLLVPFQAASTLLAVCISLVALRLCVEDSGYSTVQLAMTLVALLLSARALSSGPLALLAVLVGYVLLESGPMALRPSDELRWLFLVEPWRAAFLAFAMAVFGHAGRRITSVHPKVLSGSYAPVKWPAAPWMFFPAAVMAGLVSLYHTADPSLREMPIQLLAPYVSAATIGVIAFSTGLLPIYHGTGVLLTLGNVHLVRILIGKHQEALGLSEVHLVALGIALTLLQGSLVRVILRKENISRLITQASLVWAGLILGLISANYLVHPNLATITESRFAISGAMAFLAGWYFRRAARRPAPGEEPYAKICEGLYHFGVTMAVWCGALMIPVLRNPTSALIALALPVLYFYARAESGFRRQVETFTRYRMSAATLGFIVLAMYAFRGVVQMVIFPEATFEKVYYHANSPVLFVLGIVLLRLHAIGGTSWLSFYGGLAVMTSTYFALTALPGLSPFTHPVASAWCAIAVAHFYTIASIHRSPLRTAIQRLAGVDADGWQALRRPWGLCLLVAAHGMALWGILDFGAHPKMVAPLIIGAATVMIHQGILRGSRAYSLIAQAEIAVALHAGILVESILAPQYIVWALLGLWAAILIAQPIVVRLGGRWEPGRHVAVMAALTAAHVFYHEPWTPTGLWAFGLGAVLASLTPRDSRAPTGIGEILSAAALPFVPAWLVWFSQWRPGAGGLFQTWPVLATSAALFATGALAAFLQKAWAAEYLRSEARFRPRLYDQTISWLGLTGWTIHKTLLLITFAATAVVQVAHWGHPLTAKELVLMEGLWVAFAVAWLYVGRAEKAVSAYVLFELCLLGAFLAGRQQLHLVRGIWRLEYDVLASLAAFFACVGAKQLLERGPREALIPIRSTLLALPVFSVTWIVLHSLHTDFALLVVGLHSAAFAYMGKEDRESPYHLVAIGGFVAFVLLLFWSKLQLRMAYAYVVPVGIGVLVLLQLFKNRVPAEARNGVRAVTVLAMLGSAGWSALVSPKIPVVHNVALLGLCLAAMTLGGLLHIRMYVALGLGALLLDLLSLVVKMVALMDRSIQMTVIGSLVLLVGAGLVFGAIYYKTHRKEIAELIERFRLRFAGWE